MSYNLNYNNMLMSYLICNMYFEFILKYAILQISVEYKPIRPTNVFW
jgi:hypothetical protein